MRRGDLAAFTPVALNLSPTASIDWGNLGGIRFTDPFFDQTVENWAGGAAPRLVRTGLETLAALDDAPSLDPSLLIFHMSRCGSTLASRLLSRLPGVLVAAEPRPINSLLIADPAVLGEASSEALLRPLVRALGRRRFGDEHHYVLKLSSWNILHWRLFRRAFPGVPLVFIQRRPVEVLASIAADPPGWLALQRLPALAASFGIAEADLAAMSPRDFAARALAAMLDAAVAAEDALIVDYTELPDAVWTRIAPFAGLAAGAPEIALLRDEARYDAKSVGRHPFTQRRNNSSPEHAALAAQWLEQRYRTLDERRRVSLVGKPYSG